MPLNPRKNPVLLFSFASLLCLVSSLPAFSQDWHGGDRGGGAPPMERAFHGGEGHGRWWDNPRVAQQVGITDDQKKKMDDIFQQHRLQLIDLKAALEKQEAIMQPLIEADQQDETKILAQIDSIAQARAELEKANARMLFGIRKVLTPDQWKKLHTMVHDGPGRDRDRDGRAGEQRKGWGPGPRMGGPGGPSGSGPQQAPPPPSGGPAGESE
jgi:Spy/CpxP family protein refolding chaperone